MKGQSDIEHQCRLAKDGLTALERATIEEESELRKERDRMGAGLLTMGQSVEAVGRVLVRVSQAHSAA
eukprot:CAMPEP_0206274022 /NCGR_PEP_ID=MMETSP0047_2-20121206/34925_1 /ASSEMBLY_ACC=CAM_ASM_000192 /TAXON_ID=195065 /ORGANISM="Chroomonas mesostigmatica_cf, Strain CCMP1168" /LENGTH=67 /DNA_ID=CAMNT_0053703193 /DNA_START=6 /DNA_END=205 /DNA_ORIENTATION=-